MTVNRKSSALSILVLAFTLSACGSIPEKQFSYSSWGGQEVRTVQYHGIDRFCATKRPNIQIKEKPANGTLSIKDQEMKISEGPADIGTVGPCAGRKVIGRVVYYIPNDGFKGKDEMLLDVVFPGTTGISRARVSVNVR